MVGVLYLLCWGYGLNIGFLWQINGICSISWSTMHFRIYGKLVWDGPDGLPWSCCRYLCHPDRQQQMVGPLRPSSWVPGSMQVLVLVWIELSGTHIFQKVMQRRCQGLRHCWGVCDGIQVRDPRFKNIAHHSIWRRFPWLWDGPDELLGDFVQGFIIDDKVLSTITFRYDDDGSWPPRVTTTYDFCIYELINLILNPAIVFHSNRVWFLWDRFRVTCINLYFANWDLNDSNNSSRDHFTSKERLCKGYVKNLWNIIIV